jgi:hypothetical protein
MVRHLWQNHRWLLLGFLAALALTLVFAGRAAVLAVYWTQHRDEAIAGWMTPGYIAHSWQLPPEVMAGALGLSREDGEGRRLTLAEIAADRGVPVATLAAGVEAAIAAYRAGEEAGR